MSKYKAITNQDIDDDYILDVLKEKENEISFIRKPTRDAIKKLRNISLHRQVDELIPIWKNLLDDSIIYLKSQDKREEYPDDLALGTEKLSKFFKVFSDFEPLLYGAVNNYRDHIIHVFRVFLLGHSLIKKTIGFENMKPINGPLEIDPVEKEALWCIAALTHDLGYSLERIHVINKKAREMLEQFGTTSFQELGYGYFAQFGIISDFVIKFLSSKIVPSPLDKTETSKNNTEETENQFSTHLQAKYYQKFLSALTDFDHGVISSVILMKSLVYFKESDYLLDHVQPLDYKDARQFLIRREILRTIASHSCDDIYYLDTQNFPFILKLCDEMQDWDRPRLIDVTRRGGSNIKLRIKNFDPNLIDYQITFKASDDASDNEKKLIKCEIKTYFIGRCKTWLKVLRSAVGKRQKELQLNFYVEDNIENTVLTYCLKHTLPNRIDIIPESLRKEIMGS